MTEYGSPSTTERVWWGAVVNSNEPLRYSLDYKEIYDTSETGRSRLLQLICLRQIFVLHALFGALREAHFMAILLAQKVKSQKIPENHKKPKKPRLVRQPTEGPNAL